MRQNLSVTLSRILTRANEGFKRFSGNCWTLKCLWISFCKPKAKQYSRSNDINKRLHSSLYSAQAWIYSIEDDCCNFNNFKRPVGVFTSFGINIQRSNRHSMHAIDRNKKYFKRCVSYLFPFMSPHECWWS